MGVIQTLYDTDPYEVTPKMDGGVYATGISDAVCKGIGDEFTMTYSSLSLDVQFNAGSQAVIGGAYFRLMEQASVTLSANATIYLCANIDLGNPNGSTGSFVQRTASNMQSDNLNGSGQSRDLLLYVINTGASGVTSVQDKRLIKGDGTSLSGVEIVMGSDQINFSDISNELNLRVMTQSAYNSLSTKDSHTLYFLY